MFLILAKTHPGFFSATRYHLRVIEACIISIHNGKEGSKGEGEGSKTLGKIACFEREELGSLTGIEGSVQRGNFLSAVPSHLKKSKLPHY